MFMLTDRFSLPVLFIVAGQCLKFSKQFVCFYFWKVIYQPNDA